MNNARQLVFPLGHLPSLDAEDFIVGPSNQAAVAWIERYPEWPAPLLALHGPAGSGKSHLVQVWRARSQAVPVAISSLTVVTLPRIIAASRAVAIDLGASGPEALDQRALLHLYNLMAERAGHVLLVARDAPARWRVALADLRSRLAAAPSVGIEPPDDMLLAAVLGKLFADRQLRAEPDVVAYLARHMERSLEAAGRIVEALDREALARRRGLTTALARDVLESMAKQQ